MKRICYFLWFCLTASYVHAQYYSYPFEVPVSKLREISTPHFIIIFSENSRTEALRLASFAEEEYQSLRGYYGVFTNIGSPIRVVLSKDSHSVNGLASPVPIPVIQITLARPPESYSSIGNLANDPLRTMFRHELTHLFTLSVIAKGVPRLGYLFGNILYPNVFFASRSLIEGASVQRESDGGEGRLNDPYTYFLLRRDFYSKKARLRPPANVSGADPSYNAGHLPYTYGALFYDYLTKQFTPKFDRQIWEHLSRIKVSTEAVPDAVMDDPGQRKRTFASLWKDFEAYQRGLLPLLETVELLLPPSKRSIHSLTLRGGRLYYFNAYSRQLRRIDLASGRDSLVLYGSGQWNRVHISSDETLALVSGETLKKRLVKNFTAVISLKNGLPVEKPVYGLADAFFAPDASQSNIAYAALRIDKTNTLIYRENGKEFSLLASSPGLTFDSPVMHRSHIYFIAQMPNGRRLMRMLADGTQKEILDAPVQHVRFPAESPDSLSFAYTESATGLYKTAYITGNTLTLVKNNVKGEMLEALVRGSTVYARSAFGDSENISAVSAPQTEVSPARFLPFAEPPAANAAGTASTLPLGRRYRQARDMVPYFWLPYLSLTEAGVMLQMFDPAGADTVSLVLGVDYYRAVPQFRLEWLHASLPVDLTFYVYNRHNEFSALKNHLVAAGMNASLPLQSALNGAGALSIFFAWNGRFTGSVSLHPYQWHHLALQQLIYGGSFFWQQRVGEGRPYFYRQAALTLRASSDALNPFLWRVESSLLFSPPLIPLFVAVYGVYDRSGALPSGETLLGPSLIPRYQEYADLTRTSAWAVFSSFELLLIPGEINKGIDMGELFLQSINLFGGYRLGYWPAQGLLQSVYVRLDITISLLYGNLSVTLSQEAAYAVSRNRFSYNFNVGAGLPF